MSTAIAIIILVVGTICCIFIVVLIWILAGWFDVFLEQMQTIHLPDIDNHFGIAKKHAARSALQETLKSMVKSGRISLIYKKHGVEPLIFTDDLGFQRCFE